MPRSVTPEYRHRPKRVHFLGLRQISHMQAKLYAISTTGQRLPLWLTALVEHWIEEDGPAVAEDTDFGFLLIHQFGRHVHYLMPCMWRDGHELWQALWFHHGEMAGFQPFDPAYTLPAGTARRTFSIWEMAVVAHETRCWGRYLSSARDEAARSHWAEDHLTGMA